MTCIEQTEYYVTYFNYYIFASVKVKNELTTSIGFGSHYFPLKYSDDSSILQLVSLDQTQSRCGIVVAKDV